MSSDRAISVSTLLIYHFNEELSMSCNNDSQNTSLFFPKKIVHEGIYSDYEILIRQDNDDNEFFLIYDELKKFDSKFNVGNPPLIEYPYVDNDGNKVIEQYYISIDFRPAEYVSDVETYEDSGVYMTILACSITAQKRGDIYVDR